MYNNIISGCQTWLDMENNTLTSPNQSCSWLITANFKSHIILNFTFIEVSPHTFVPSFYLPCIAFHQPRPSFIDVQLLVIKNFAALQMCVVILACQK